MTGLPPGRAPRTDAELILSLQRQIRALRSARTLRVGSFTIAAVGDQLVVSKDGTDPNVIDSSGNPVEPEQFTLGRGQFRALDAVLESQGVTADAEPETIRSVFARLLNPDSPLDSYKLNGSPPRGFFDMIPVSALGPAVTNMLANAHFVGPQSVVGLDEWDHDATITHSKGVTGAGSAHTVLSGAVRELGSNPISVVPGQRVPMRMYLRWLNLVLSGGTTPFQLIAQAYQEGQLVHDQVLRKVGRAGTSPDWVELRGEYTVPDEVNEVAIAPDEVRMVVRVETNATSGEVWASDGLLTKKLMQGILDRESIEGLSEGMSMLDESDQMVMAAIIKAITGTPGVGWLFGDLEGRVADFFDDTQFTAGRADDAWTIGRGLVGAVVRSIFGNDTDYDPNSTDGARGALDSLNSAVSKATRDLQAMQARDAGESANGKIINVDFSDYPDGPLPSIFTVRYTGPGTSQLVIKKGVAQWNKTNNNNRDAWVLYNVEPTATNFQLLRGTMSSPPEDTTDGGRPHFYALGRVSSPAAETADGGISCVWVRAWSVGTLFLYRGDIGCVKNGVEYVWASNIPLTWSLDMTFVVGVGIAERQYQVFSGNTLIYTYDELAPPGGTQVGGLSKLALDTFNADNERVVDNRYRGWGSLAQLRYKGSPGSNNTPKGGGAIAGCSVADNELPSVVGSTAMMYRTNTAGVQITGGSSEVGIPNNFWEFVGRASRDIRINTGAGTFQVTRTDNYTINARIQLADSYTAAMFVLLQVNKGSGWVTIGWGDYAYPNDSSRAALSGHWTEQLEAGDLIRLATFSNGINVNGLTGATAGRTKFDITGHGMAA